MGYRYKVEYEVELSEHPGLGMVWPKLRVLDSVDPCGPAFYVPENAEVTFLGKTTEPGFYGKFRDGQLVRTFGVYEIYKLEAPNNTLPELLSEYEWRRVTVEEVE